MLSARDSKTKKIILASDPSARRLALICPQCEAPVRLRAGYFKQPYFAHVAHEAKPECKLFHEAYLSSVVVSHTPLLPPKPNVSVSITRLTQSKTNDEFSSEVPALYLSWNKVGTFDLKLKFPKVRSEHQWSGTLIVKSTVGEQRIKYQNLNVSYFLNVHPQHYDYSIKFEGEVDQIYKNQFQEGVSGLETGKNVFRSSDAAGRLLPVDAPLYWEEHYWILINREYNDVENAPEALQIACFALDDSWIVLDLVLPGEEAGLDPRQREEIEAWLGRPVKTSIATAYLRSPFPCRFTEEGAYVVPEEHNEFRVHRTQNLPLTARNENNQQLRVFEEDANTVRVFAERALFIYFYLNTRLAFCVQREKLPLFSPSGIKIEDSLSSFEIFEAYKHFERLRSFRTSAEDFQIKFSADRLSACVRINEIAWEGTPHLRKLLEVKEQSLRIDAGAFGRIVLNADIPPMESRSLTRDMEYRILFLWGLSSSMGPHRPFSELENVRSMPKLLRLLTLGGWESKYLPQLLSLRRELQNEGFL